MPHGWISRLKKSHDLEVCTRPTCRGILVYGIRKKIFSGRKWHTYKYSFFGKKYNCNL